MARFINNKRPNVKTNNNTNNQSAFSKKYAKFSVFVIAGLVIVGLIVGLLFYFNYSNNSLRMFVKSSSKAFDSGSFDFHISARINGELYMDYDGTAEIDVDKNYFTSNYHAVYPDYEYDSILYTHNGRAYNGNYYNGKWNVSDSTTSVLDFFSFYKSYREGEFNAAAALRFIGMTKDFNAPNLEQSMSTIFKELSKPNGMNNILHQNVVTENGATTITFTPEIDKLFALITENIAPAFHSANDYMKFKEQVNNSIQTQKDARAVISYTISKDGYLTDASINYTVNRTNYIIDVKLSNFSTAKVSIPESFYVVAGIEQ